MKKILSLTLALVLLFTWGGTTVFAAYEAPVQFAKAYNYGDEIFHADWYVNNGWGIAYFGYDSRVYKLSNKVKGLPQEDDILKLCVYNNKFYFLTQANYDWEHPWITSPAKIYSCNLDGSGLTLLADNASQSSNVTIVDNMLYYENHDAFLSWYNIMGLESHIPWGNPGIIRINLYDLSWEQICNDRAVEIQYCDGDYIYYFANCDSYGYAIRTDGTGKMQVNTNCDEFLHSYHSGNYYLKGNQFYYFYKNKLFCRNKNDINNKAIASIQQYFFTDDDGSILAVTDNAILCVDDYFVGDPYTHSDTLWIQTVPR